MQHLMACACAVAVLVLAGCYDFASLDVLPDGAAIADGARLPGSDLASHILVDEPFDSLDLVHRWDPGTAPSSAFTIDDTTKVEGSGALAIDTTALDTLNTGALHWIGSPLPTTSGSRHLRLYMRYDGALDSNVDMALLTDTAGEGLSITLAPIDPSRPSQGANVVINAFGNNETTFQASGSVVQAAAWHCYELGVDQTTGGASWQATLRVDDVLQPQGTVAAHLMSQVQDLYVGFNLAQAVQTGAMTAWIDSVVLTDDAATIGCPD